MASILAHSSSVSNIYDGVPHFMAISFNSLTPTILCLLFFIYLHKFFSVNFTILSNRHCFNLNEHIWNHPLWHFVFKSMCYALSVKLTCSFYLKESENLILILSNIQQLLRSPSIAFMYVSISPSSILCPICLIWKSFLDEKKSSPSSLCNQDHLCGI